MVNFNEEILRLIFDYLETPLQWIQVSQVCRLWKTAASKQWRKITEINYLSRDLYDRKLILGDVNKATVISMKDAEKIVHFAAPFVKVLNGSRSFYGNQLIMFGPFFYKVSGFNGNTIIKLLAQNATGITEIYFDKPPESELLNLLAKTNVIKKVKFDYCKDFYKTSSTDDIEELHVYFSDTEDIQSFSGSFPNLKKLDLELNCESLEHPQEMLSSILPYVQGLTSFRLYMDLELNQKVSCKAFFDLAKFSQLEILALMFHGAKVTAVDLFLKKLAKNRPKLREVKLSGMAILEKQLYNLLTLPNLENLDVASVASFQSLEIPELMNLTKLTVTYNCAKFDIKSFCNVLKKMPKLKVLGLRIDPESLLDHPDFVTHDHTLNLVCEIAIVISSQNKHIFINQNHIGSSSFKVLKIERKNEDLSDKEIETLNVTVVIENENDFFEDVKVFVRNKLKSYFVDVVDDRNEKAV